MKETLAELMMRATELQALGAIRPEHHERYSAFRTMLEQAHAQAVDPEPLPDAVIALTELRDQVQGLSVLIDVQGDKLDAIAETVGAVEPEAPAV